MPPLTRQRTFDSIRSWWSDRNLPGPTINLHAVAKPLIRFMYHRQVLGFIKRIHGAPLSEDALQLCWDYLAYKYISPATKAVILSELCRRVDSIEEAHTVVDSVVFRGVMELLQARDAMVRAGTCEILGRVAVHESTATVVLGLRPCVQLVSFIHDQPVEVVEAAIYALSWIAFWPDGAQAVLEAKTLDHVAELLQSPEAEVRKWTCWTVGSFARHESTAVAVLGLKPCPQLVGLLRDQPVKVVYNAMYALSQIAFWPDGAQAALEAKTLDHVVELLQSPQSRVQGQTCWMVGTFAKHESTAVAILGLKPCPQLVGLLRDQPVEVVEVAMYALSKIAFWPEGAQAALEAKTLDHVVELLQSPESGVRKWTCEMVGSFAKHESTAMAVLELKPCPQLVGLLHDQPVEVIEAAITASISSVWGPATDMLDGRKLVGLLHDQPVKVVEAAIYALSEISSWPNVLGPTTDVLDGGKLVGLLRDQPVEVIEAAMYALHEISSWPDGAQAALEAKTLDHVAELLQSPQSGVQRWTCWMVGGFALVGLLRDQPGEVIEAAMYALHEISSWPNGAQAALDAKILDHVAELLQSPQSGVRRWTCWMVGSFAKHKSTAVAILGLKPCPQLVGLLHYQPVEVIEAAMYALYEISSWPDGVQAALEAKTLDHVVELLESPQSGVQQWTRWMVGRFAKHESTAMAVLGLELLKN
ncbi:armadillo-type protein [Mycena leptocephala]|nr:armadillo-type protein [Mycena leptocephala]